MNVVRCEEQMITRISDGKKQKRPGERNLHLHLRAWGTRWWCLGSVSPTPGGSTNQRKRNRPTLECPFAEWNTASSCHATPHHISKKETVRMWACLGGNTQVSPRFKPSPSLVQISLTTNISRSKGFLFMRRTRYSPNDLSKQPIGGLFSKYAIGKLSIVRNLIKSNVFHFTLHSKWSQQIISTGSYRKDLSLRMHGVIHNKVSVLESSNQTLIQIFFTPQHKITEYV